MCCRNSIPHYCCYKCKRPKLMFLWTRCCGYLFQYPILLMQLAIILDSFGWATWSSFTSLLYELCCGRCVVLGSNIADMLIWVASHVRHRTWSCPERLFNVKIWHWYCTQCQRQRRSSSWKWASKKRCVEYEAYYRRRPPDILQIGGSRRWVICILCDG